MVKRPESIPIIQFSIMLHLSRPFEHKHSHGPIAALIEHVRDCGGTIGADLIIRVPNETDIDIWNMPWQHLKKAVFDLAGRSRAKHFNMTRTYQGDIDEFDQTIICSIMNSFGDHEARVLRYIATGAFWDEAHKACINTSDGTCPHCMKRDIDSEHIHWNCPCINAHRNIKHVANIDPACLPKCVKVGIPPALSASFTQPFWGSTLQPETPVFDNSASLIGIPKGTAAFNRASADNRTVNIALNQVGQQLGNHNARQVFANLKDLTKHSTLPIPYRLTLAPPAQINVYSDGSWQFPLKHYFALWGVR